MPLNSELARDAIPFLLPDLPRSEDIQPYLKRIDEARWYSNFGPLQQEFEQGLTRLFFPDLNPAMEQVVTCSSGTAAIELALLALGLPAGARVLVPSFTFAASATAIVRAGMEPVFADVDPDSWLLTPEIAALAVNHIHCDAVLPVAALGLPQDAQAWSGFSARYGLPVVIDAAAALGDQGVARGITVCYSLHATKAFGVGEGGIVCLPDRESALRARELSNFGFSNGDLPVAGGNYKFSEYHAAVGLAQLTRAAEIAGKRQRVRAAYQNGIRSLDGLVCIQKPSKAKGSDDIVLLDNAGFHGAACLGLTVDLSQCGTQWFASQLNGMGIGTRLWYTPALHNHSAFRSSLRFSPDGGDHLIVTEWLESSIIGVPFHNFLTVAEIDYICQCVKQACEQVKLRKPQLINL